MTLETIADMVWALGYAIKIIIYDPSKTSENDVISDLNIPAAPTKQKPISAPPPTISNYTITLPPACVGKTTVSFA